MALLNLSLVLCSLCRPTILTQARGGELRKGRGPNPPLDFHHCQIRAPNPLRTTAVLAFLAPSKSNTQSGAIHGEKALPFSNRKKQKLIRANQLPVPSRHQAYHNSLTRLFDAWIRGQRDGHLILERYISSSKLSIRGDGAGSVCYCNRC